MRVGGTRARARPHARPPASAASAARPETIGRIEAVIDARDIVDNGDPQRPSAGSRPSSVAVCLKVA